MKKISIIIVCYNQWQYTEYCLKSLLCLDQDITQIILIDNASTDNTSMEIQKLLNSKNLIYIKNNENVFHSAASNIGYAKSNGDIIIFLNNDIRIKNINWIDDIIKSSVKNPNSIMGPTGGYVDPDNQFQFLYETQDTAKKINYISGWCLFATRNTFDKLIDKKYSGPWSEEFPFYFNDGDLSFRASDLNIELKLVPLPLYHFGKISSKSLNINKLYNEGRTKFIHKWSKI